ncbi:MAG: serine/threonine protein kinase [Deltaproteobacteria bacterium]|nr:serine/threonine protein kinase [Deltaproteobacteria bacterium]
MTSRTGNKKYNLPQIKPGDMIGEYRVRRLLDSGGMGTVYAGVHPVIGKKVAIKILHPHVAQNPENISRFKQEASVVNAIGDPGIVDIFSFGEHEGRYYFVMEYLKGERLLEFLRRQGRISGFAAAQLLRMLALSMAAAHDKNVIHRDIKAENIFLVPSNDGYWPPRSKILDFGLAKLAMPLPGQQLPQTRQGVTLGTPYYMSPEQCRGLALDARSDIYSLGVLAYEMVTGSLPFMHKDAIEVMHMHLKNEISLEPGEDLPRLMVELIKGCLEKKPDDRPQDMREFITSLESIFPTLSPNAVQPQISSSEDEVSGLYRIDDIPDSSVDSPEIHQGDNADISSGVLAADTDIYLKKSADKKYLMIVFSSGLLIGLLLGTFIGKLF